MRCLGKICCVGSSRQKEDKEPVVSREKSEQQQKQVAQKTGIDKVLFLRSNHLKKEYENASKELGRLDSSSNEQTPESVVKEWLHGAEKTLDICMAQLTYSDLYESLEFLSDKYNNGGRQVKIRIIVRNSNSLYENQNLVVGAQPEGIQVRYLGCRKGFEDYNEVNVNSKFVVRDSKQVMTGSCTWQRPCFSYNFETIYFISDTEFVRQHQDEFEVYWQMASEVPMENPELSNFSHVHKL